MAAGATSWASTSWEPTACEELLELTDGFAEVNARPLPKVPALRGTTVVLAFFEDSTRTRVSFETAAKRLSADTISFSSSGTSLSKGESLRDTALTIEAMGVGRPGRPPRLLRRALAAGPLAGPPHPRGQRRRRLARAPHPGAARLLDDPPPLRRPRRPPRRPRRRHQPLPGGPLRRGRLQPAGRRRDRGGAPHAAAAVARGLGAGAGQAVGHRATSTGCIGSVDVVYLLRMQRERQTEALVPSLREYSARFGLERGPGRPAADRAPWCSTPGP